MHDKTLQPHIVDDQNWHAVRNDQIGVHKPIKSVWVTLQK